MRRKRMLVLSLMICSVWIAATASAQQSITVQVSLRNLAGDGLEGVPVFIQGTVDDSTAADLTDDNGVAQCTLVVPPGVDDLIVVPTERAASRVATTFQEAVEIAEHAKAVLSQYSVPGHVSVPLVQGTTSYMIDIVAQEAITVSGRIVDSTGEGLDGLVVLQNGASFARAEQDPLGDFSVGGLRQGAASRLFVYGGSNLVKVVDVSAASAQADHSLGDIVIPSMTDLGGSAEIQIQTSRLGELDSRVHSNADACTLISADGTLVLQLMVDPNGRLISGRIPDPPPILLPAGRYYLAPGPPPGEIASHLLDLARAGTVDLAAAGVPVIDAVADTTVSQSVDGVAARDAIMQAGDP